MPGETPWLTSQKVSTGLSQAGSMPVRSAGGGRTVGKTGGTQSPLDQVVERWAIPSQAVVAMVRRIGAGGEGGGQPCGGVCAVLTLMFAASTNVQHAGRLQCSIRPLAKFVQPRETSAASAVATVSSRPAG